MTDPETITRQAAEIAKLKRKVTRLEKRLLEKKKYDDERLIYSGATPEFIRHIDDKDQAALRGE